MIRFTFAAILITTCSSMAYGEPDKKRSFKVPSKGITQEVWEGIRGNEIEKLTNNGNFKKGNPTSARILENLDSGEMGDEYGVRYTAYLVPPKTGEYTFWVAADDAAQLFLGKDQSAEGAEMVAEIAYYTGRHNFQNRGKSAPIKLEAGKKYYLSLLHKEGSGEDYVAVAWSSPDLKREIIKGKYLVPYVDDNKDKALQKTREEDKQKQAIVSKFLSLSKRDVPAYIEGLSKKDNELLTSHLISIMGTEKKLEEKEFMQKLKPYVERAQSIMASEEKPLKDSASKMLLHLEETYLKKLSFPELKRLGAHRLSSALGEIPRGVKPVQKGVKLNSREGKHRNELVSTGFYALPGVPFKIAVPENLVGSSLKLQVGHHIPPNNPRRDLVSMPETTRVFNIRNRVEEFITPHGGLILLDVPPKLGLKDVTIEMKDVIQAPRFVLGETTDEEWNSTIRNYPAPWGEVVSEHLTMIVSSPDLKQLSNPTELMTWWNENNRRLEDFYAYYPQVPFRMHAALYAREGVSYWPLEWNPKNIVELLNIERMKEVNSALYLHEHGHHADFGDMEFGYISESTPNWGGYYMKSQIPFEWKDTPTQHMVKLMDPNNEQHREIMQKDWYKISTKGTHHWSYPVTSMMLAYTEDFGWEPFKKTIHRLRDREDEMYSWPFTDRKTDDQAKIDRYVVGLSQEAKRDVRPYFAHFYMIPSEGAAAFLDKLALPTWDAAHLPPPENTTVKAGQSLTIPNPDKAALTLAESVKVTWKQPENGNVTSNANGDLIYTPKEGFSGKDKIPYTLTTPSGENPPKYIQITVEP